MTDKSRIIFVDDDPKAGELFARFSHKYPFESLIYQDPEAALQNVLDDGAELIITDLNMPGMTGMQLLQGVREHGLEIPVIIITGYSSVDNAIEALRLGASDFIKKPYDMEELLLQVERNLEHVRLREENRLLKRQLMDEQLRFGMIGESAAIKKVFSIIDKISDIRCSVIIEGESGTGKELVARAIHQQSQFAEEPFIVIDCGALTDTLLESELFGHEKGAFTGADKVKQGLLEAASGGTVFLDEICNISEAMQTKLLRVVQEQQVTRVGGIRPNDIDVRFIAATNRNIEAMVEAGEFRHDLYHRLNVVKITVPPLRARKDDIPLLADAFIKQFAEQFHRDVEAFDSASMTRLLDYAWPGNVRELRNLIERYVALADAPLITLDEELGSPMAQPDTIDSDLPDLSTLEQRYIHKLLAHFNDNREQTAQALGINKSTLWRKLQQSSKDDANSG